MGKIYQPNKLFYMNCFKSVFGLIYLDRHLNTRDLKVIKRGMRHIPKEMLFIEVSSEHHYNFICYV